MQTMTSWSSPLTGPPEVLAAVLLELELELFELFELQPLSMATAPKFALAPARASALVPAAFKKLRLVVVCDIVVSFYTFPKRWRTGAGARTLSCVFLLVVPHAV
jgi:hypothetical protein